MDADEDNKKESSEDYRWLLKEVTSGDYWFALDSAVDWIKKKEKNQKQADKKKKKNENKNSKDKNKDR